MSNGGWAKMKQKHTPKDAKANLSLLKKHTLSWLFEPVERTLPDLDSTGLDWTGLIHSDHSDWTGKRKQLKDKEGH